MTVAATGLDEFRKFDRARGQGLFEHPVELVDVVFEEHLRPRAVEDHEPLIATARRENEKMLDERLQSPHLHGQLDLPVLLVPEDHVEELSRRVLQDVAVDPLGGDVLRQRRSGPGTAVDEQSWMLGIRALGEALRDLAAVDLVTTLLLDELGSRFREDRPEFPVDPRIWLRLPVVLPGKGLPRFLLDEEARKTAKLVHPDRLSLFPVELGPDLHLLVSVRGRTQGGPRPTDERFLVPALRTSREPAPMGEKLMRPIKEFLLIGDARERIVGHDVAEGSRPSLLEGGFDICRRARAKETGVVRPPLQDLRDHRPVVVGELPARLVAGLAPDIGRVSDQTAVEVEALGDVMKLRALDVA